MTKEKVVQKFIYRCAKKSVSWFRNVKPIRNLSTIWKKGLLLKLGDPGTALKRRESVFFYPISPHSY